MARLKQLPGEQGLKDVVLGWVEAAQEVAADDLDRSEHKRPD